MNYSNIIRQIVPRREAIAGWQNLLPPLFAVLVVVFFGVMVYLTFTAPETHIVTGAETASIRANPELSAYNRYASDLAAREAATFLATNPEINSYRRYQANMDYMAQWNILATNPELMIAGHYIPGRAAALAKAKVFATNPELMIFQPFKQAAEERFLAENPELNAYQRFVAGW